MVKQAMRRLKPSGQSSTVTPLEHCGQKKTIRLCTHDLMEGRRQMLGTVLLILLVLFLVGALPTWPYSSGWGYYPSGGLGLVLLIVLILVLLGRV